MSESAPSKEMAAAKKTCSARSDVSDFSVVVPANRPQERP
jgi:hypothetical protein